MIHVERRERWSHVNTHGPITFYNKGWWWILKGDRIWTIVEKEIQSKAFMAELRRWLLMEVWLWTMVDIVLVEMG